MLGKILIASVLLLFAASCTAKAPVPVRIDAVRPPVQGTDSIPTKISRAEYIEVLKNQKSLQRLRLVPILTSAKFQNTIPEYRLFDVEQGGAAHFLGLRNADILVAANGYIIYDQEKFKTYLILLQNESRAEIEIRRDGRHILYKYIFY